MQSKEADKENKFIPAMSVGCNYAKPNWAYRCNIIPASYLYFAFHFHVIFKFALRHSIVIFIFCPTTIPRNFSILRLDILVLFFPLGLECYFGV